MPSKTKQSKKKIWENNIISNKIKNDKHKDENMTTKNSANILFMRSKWVKQFQNLKKKSTNIYEIILKRTYVEKK